MTLIEETGFCTSCDCPPPTCETLALACHIEGHYEQLDGDCVRDPDCPDCQISAALTHRISYLSIDVERLLAAYPNPDHLIIPPLGELTVEFFADGASLTVRWADQTFCPDSDDCHQSPVYISELAGRGYIPGDPGTVIPILYGEGMIGGDRWTTACPSRRYFILDPDAEDPHIGHGCTTTGLVTTISVVIRLDGTLVLSCDLPTEMPPDEVVCLPATTNLAGSSASTEQNCTAPACGPCADKAVDHYTNAIIGGWEGVVATWDVGSPPVTAKLRTLCSNCAGSLTFKIYGTTVPGVGCSTDVDDPANGYTQLNAGTDTSPMPCGDPGLLAPFLFDLFTVTRQDCLACGPIHVADGAERLALATVPVVCDPPMRVTVVQDDDGTVWDLSFGGWAQVYDTGFLDYAKFVTIIYCNGEEIYRCCTTGGYSAPTGTCVPFPYFNVAITGVGPPLCADCLPDIGGGCTVPANVYCSRNSQAEADGFAETEYANCLANLCGAQGGIAEPGECPDP